MSTSSSKAEREKLQLIQEKSQQILTELLKDEDNKYCVDCDAKGPRWASWNLGVFLCIRCAGIHRNMGVHISKVKSVNLDSWSAEQVAYMQLMGNSKARAVYEANLPDNFKRPQVDSALEQFVRAKYEHKKYIAKEWVEPPTPKPAFDIEEERKKEKEKKRNKIIKTQTNSTIVEVQTNPVPRPHSSGALNNDKNGTNGIKLPSSDLLGLNTASNQIASSVKSNTSSLNDDDQFDAFVSCAPVLTTTSSASTKKDNLVNINETNKTTATKTNEEEDFFNQKAPEKKILDKESILKLYETSTNNNLNQAQSNLFNLNTQQPVNNGGFNTNPLLIPTNGQQIINPLQPNNQTNLFQSTTQSTVNNGFAKFNNQSANLISQPFLPFNQTSNQIAKNPFLTPETNSIAPVTNGTSSTDLFSSINTNLSATKNLETQLNGLNLTNQDTFNWPSTNGNTANISVGQSLFSANFDNLNTDKKLNTNGLSTPLTNNISPANPFLNNTIQPTIQQTNNLDILSSFNTTNGLNNKATNDLDNNWSNFSSATTNNTLTADIWQ